MPQARVADGNTLRLDLTDRSVDTLEVIRAPEHGTRKLGVERQQELAAQLAGELLEGLEIALILDRMPEAGDYAKRIRERMPDYSMADFLGALRMAPDATDLCSAQARVAGAEARRTVAVRDARAAGRLERAPVLHGIPDQRAEPQIAVFYRSVFPQLVRPEHGSVLAQSLTLGFVQIAVSFAVNLSIILSAAQLAAWFAKNPLWLGVQRWIMGCVLGGLAVRLALGDRRN